MKSTGGTNEIHRGQVVFSEVLQFLPVWQHHCDCLAWPEPPGGRRGLRGGVLGGAMGWGCWRGFCPGGGGGGGGLSGTSEELGIPNSRGHAKCVGVHNPNLRGTPKCGSP